nr:helix-turn-helix domain-containing protein [Acholeplasma laidlawii]
MGRPRYLKPDNFDEIVSLFKDKQISLSEAISTLELSKSTFYKYL